MSVASAVLRPRVLLHAFSTFEAGGAQVRFLQLANAFGGGFRHRIVAMDGNFSAGERLNSGVDWQPVNIENHRGGALANRAQFRQHLARLKPDLLLTYNWGAIEWMAANLPTLVPHVHVEDGFHPDELKRQLPRRLWTRRALYALSNARLLVPSLRLREVARSWWVPDARVSFVPNGVSCPQGVRISAPPGVGEPIVVGTVAALRAEKNIQRLLRAVAALRQKHNLRLLIVGDGRERAGLERCSQELGLTDICEFTGYMANPGAAFAQMHLFALSSDTEQLPMAMLEAMASGVPVVATAVGDVPRLMPEVAHEALSAPDDAAFERTLEHVLLNQADWPNWALAGLACVRSRYDVEQMLNDWRMVFSGGWPRRA